MSWTEERIERLKKMWHDGATASQIADELGGVSRNAVIGKAHRLGLEQRPSPVKPGLQVHATPPEVSAQVASGAHAAEVSPQASWLIGWQVPSWHTSPPRQSLAVAQWFFSDRPQPASARKQSKNFVMVVSTGQGASRAEKRSRAQNRATRPIAV